MNCLEFRREKLADPRRLSAEAASHALGCAGCAAFGRSVDESERDLERVLATPVPDGLADRVLLRAGAVRPVRRAWARAASVVLALTAGMLFYNGSGRLQDDCARLAIEHVVMEPESFTAVRNADAEAFRAVVQSFGGTLKAPLGELRYFKLCPFEDGMGWHIVFQTPEGLATLMLIPGKPPAGLQRASIGRWSAVVRPTRGGYYAVVMPSAAATERVERLVRERIDWSA